MKIFKKYKQKGSSILLTILIMSALLTAALGISKLGLGEIKLSRNIDRTIVAFAVADAGSEAALFYERDSLGGAGGRMSIPEPHITQQDAINDGYLTNNDLCLDYPSNQMCFSFDIYTDDNVVPPARPVRYIISRGSYGDIQRAVELTYDL